MIDVETQESRWYTKGMGRPISTKEKKNEKISAKVTKFLKDEVARVMEETDRTESYVASALMMRGLAAYNLDKNLHEPEPEIDKEDASTSKARVLRGHKRAEHKTSRRA